MRVLAVLAVAVLGVFDPSRFGKHPQYEVKRVMVQNIDEEEAPKEEERETEAPVAN
eukprot:CAMPEP_0204286330 /NCGR_PEP_ID=MMETSP0468-20130131/52536_1 /ASSEMBLY_ACC=CAM_ASM_000383 /TAXON_ID=2969 /ORGANISM="Oxyrrhis marina" /LENGTH=55 /DNA_ID=CAMNT_0051264233 /DNA_START=71 /DNA_END=238 /DNA_ORIENTATION=+